jgi:phosphoribosyl 1,2-cyclic phosphodiesterase
LPDKSSKFWFRFWGTRGSLPAPHPSTVIYGGNTPCVEVRAEEKIIILDAGSGIRQLGEQLEREFPRGLQASIFFSHYHWDHIHGFPFFLPAYRAKNRFVIYGEPRGSRQVKDILSGQMALPYFPIPIEIMKARFDFRDIWPGMHLQLGKVTISTEALNHPGRSLSFRISFGGRSLVYATDTEHVDKIDQSLVEHARGADVLIYDATYTDAEMRNGKKGYGHSTWREGVKVARAAGVKRLLLFHHDTNRTDSALQKIELSARRAFPRAAAARERKIYCL